MNTITGTLLCALGGVAGATFALPFRCIKTRVDETYWFVYALFGLVLFPLFLASATCPNLFGIIGGAAGPTVMAVGAGSQGGLCTACSSLYFEPMQQDAAWRITCYDQGAAAYTLALI